MHRSYQPLLNLDESQERGMSRISQLIEDAKRTTIEACDKSNADILGHTDNSVACPISNRTNPLDAGRDKQTECRMSLSMDEPETTTRSTAVFSAPQLACIAQSVLHLFESEETTDTPIYESTTFDNIDCPNRHESLPRTNQKDALSRYITVWLEHGWVVDKHLGCPQHAVLQPRIQNRKRKRKSGGIWYFQQDR